MTTAIFPSLTWSRRRLATPGKNGSARRCRSCPRHAASASSGTTAWARVQLPRCSPRLARMSEYFGESSGRERRCARAAANWVMGDLRPRCLQRRRARKIEYSPISRRASGSTDRADRAAARSTASKLAKERFFPKMWRPPTKRREVPLCSAKAWSPSAARGCAGQDHRRGNRRESEAGRAV